MEEVNHMINNIVDVELIDPYSLKLNLQRGEYFALNIVDMSIYDVYNVSINILCAMKEQGYIFIKIIKKEDEKS